MIHLEISQGDPSSDRITKDTIGKPKRQDRDTSSQMATDSASQNGVPQTEKDLPGGTDPPTFSSGPADHSSNECKWICHCTHPQPVGCFRGSQSGQFLLPEVVFSWTELRHLWSRAIGHRGFTETVAALPQGRQLKGLNSVWPQESQILPDIQSANQKTSQVVGNPFDLSLCHPVPSRQLLHGRRPIPMAQLWDWLRKACGPTIANHISGTVPWSHASNHCGPGRWPFGCLCLGEASRQANCRWHRFRRKGERMENHCGGSDLQREYIHPCSQPPTRKSDKSISSQPWVWTFWSS